MPRQALHVPELLLNIYTQELVFHRATHCTGATFSQMRVGQPTSTQERPLLSSKVESRRAGSSQVESRSVSLHRRYSRNEVVCPSIRPTIKEIRKSSNKLDLSRGFPVSDKIWTGLKALE